MDLVIEPLSPRHDRRTFACGKADLDHWFHQQADRDAHKGTRVFVAVDHTFGVVGVYSLNFITLALENLPQTQAHLLPRPGSAPAALIGSLARDLRVHGQGIAARLLVDAIHRVLGAAKTLPLIAVIAEVNDAHTAAFYDSFGFRPFPRVSERAFLLTASVMTALDGQKP